jgi:hypothetical protein
MESPTTRQIAALSFGVSPPTACDQGARILKNLARAQKPAGGFEMLLARVASALSLG